jgi:hypothetical protein
MRAMFAIKPATIAQILTRSLVMVFTPSFY